MINLIEILGNPNSFLEKIFENLKNDKIDVSNYELDHICYRVENLERHKFLKNKLLNLGFLLSENKINGRLIPLIKLKNPIIFQKRSIFIIELPEPSKSFFKEGFEHVEFVIDDFDNFLKKYNYLDFDKNSLNKKINADIARKYNDFAIKFHLQTLEYVVTFLEK